MAESHEKWCEQVAVQRRWPHPYDMAWHDILESNDSMALGRSWANRGKGFADGDVGAAEVAWIVKEWDKSDATTPDLVPRAVLKLKCVELDAVVVVLMRLLGPGALATRPYLWRFRCMVPEYKRGPLSDVDSWRVGSSDSNGTLAGSDSFSPSEASCPELLDTRSKRICA